MRNNDKVCAVCDKTISKADKSEAVSYRVRVSARSVLVHSSCDWIQNDTRLIREENHAE